MILQIFKYFVSSVLPGLIILWGKPRQYNTLEACDDDVAPPARVASFSSELVFVQYLLVQMEKEENEAVQTLIIHTYEHSQACWELTVDI